MSADQLTAEAMALPLQERISLAQALWESIEGGMPDTDEHSAAAEAIRRDEELSSGSAVGRAHSKVMEAARHAIGCE